ncbi:hypothetical protein JTE90_018349 [Oedothorax gibbosus]|uniref:Nitrilase and fragile histidine triad fusion protein NitFhit n=1 Tax=Oedothorax gibbosus TaxID=931172 RepID=A0AAV6TZP4_9ARAC|nr:hypothetical protein JTE90_018349 [Oedothorax gibbosus]
MNSVCAFTKSTLVYRCTASLLLSKIHHFPSLVQMELQRPLTVAVCQINATADRKKNFETCKSFIDIAASKQAKVVFLPECFDHVAESKNQSIELSESLDGPLMTEYKKLAVQHSLWLSLGGFHEKGPPENENKIYNSHVLVNLNGEIVSVYRKIHLFDVDIPGSVRLKESDYVIPGQEIVPPVDTPIGKVGLGICYDMRFPEFALSLTKGGAEILTYPSAFTQTTGMAHWEPLLRSRAIETQSYVIAAAQTGRHNPKRISYGHALVIDPWGCVIASCSEGEGVTCVDINPDYVRKIRKEMPVWQHRRGELYSDILPPKSQEKTSVTKYMFGPHELHPECIFYKTNHSMAFVNKKCVVPGHVLVTPIRCAKRLSDLTASEMSDLFLCVQKVQKNIEIEYKAGSSCVAIQDGPEAGQTVAHVHVHILPRKPGDFEKNDDVYVELATHDKGEDVKWRSLEEMIEEASRLKKYF